MILRCFNYQKWQCLGYCVDIHRRKTFESHFHLVAQSELTHPGSILNHENIVEYTANIS